MYLYVIVIQEIPFLNYSCTSVDIKIFAIENSRRTNLIFFKCKVLGVDSDITSVDAASLSVLH